HHEDVGEASGDRLLDDVLEGGLVDDREHLLGHRLRGREEARAQSCNGDDGLAHRWELTVRHAGHSKLGSMESAVSSTSPSTKAAMRADIRTRRAARVRETASGTDSEAAVQQDALSTRVRARVDTLDPAAV